MADKRQGEVHEVSFRPAKGGVVSATHVRYKRGGQGGGADWDHESQMAVHPTMKHASAHLKKSLGHCFGDGEAEE